MPSATTTLPYTGGTQAFYSSQWAEVIYYLKRTGSTEEPNNPTSNLGTPTFELYRAQFVMVPDGTELRKATTPAPNTNVFVAPPPTAPAAQFTQFDNWSRTIFHQMSTSVENVGVAGPRWELWFPSPAEAARGIRLLKNTGTVSGLTAFNTQIPVGTTYNPLTARVIVNEAPVLPNVLSFQVKTMAHVQPWDGATAYLANDIVWFNNISFRAIVGNTGQQPGSPQSNAWRQMLAPDVPLSPFAFADIPPSPMTSPVANRVRLYDTTLINVGLTNTFGGATTNRFGLKAIQITIRVFDHKTRQTRQVSIVQDL
jgi:hypothetical protein